MHVDWKFRRRRRGKEEEVSVRVPVKRSSDDGAVVRDWAIAGAGIAYKAWLDVASDVHAGRLVIVLEDWQGKSSPLNLVFAYREFQPPLLRCLIDFLAARGAELPVNMTLSTRPCTSEGTERLRQIPSIASHGQPDADR